MIAAVIVIGTLVLAVAFCLAWLIRPDVRARIERPKHGFHANVQAYDRSRRAQSDVERGAK